MTIEERVATLERENAEIKRALESIRALNESLAATLEQRNQAIAEILQAVLNKNPSLGLALRVALKSKP